MTPYLPNGSFYNNVKSSRPLTVFPQLKYLLIVVVWLVSILLLFFLRTKATSLINSDLGDYQKLGRSTSSFVMIAPNTRPVAIFSKAYLLLDAESSEILVSKNESVSLPVASTTKITTAMTALQIYKPDEIITVPKKATLINGSKIGLRTGEKLTTTVLLKGMLISSGNDAAYTLALAADPKQEDTAPFVEKMNIFLKAHHISSSNYADPAGLDDEKGRSTCLDLAHLSRLLLSSDILAPIVRTADTSITSTDGAITHQLKNSNRLLLSETPYYMPSVIGVKTGFTLDAGHSLVAAYQWHDRVLIGVVLNTNESTIEASAKEMSKLFHWADSNLTLRSYQN